MQHGKTLDPESNPVLSGPTASPPGCPGKQNGDPSRGGGYDFIFADTQPWPGLTSRAATERMITELSEAMRDYNDNSAIDDNPAIPAGYTYLGQLIVHDLTQFRFDPQGRSTQSTGGAKNMRTPSLDLDCLYGAGPDLAPTLYQRSTDRNDDFRFLLRTGQNHTKEPTASQPTTLPKARDIARVTENSRGIAGPDAAICADALIADARNDDHLIISQLHLAFSLIHNRAAAYFKQQSNSNRTAFQSARQFVQTCYRSIIRHDYLGRILCPAIYNDFVSSQPQLTRLPEGSPLAQNQLPLEYTLAAGRFGHAMARGFYAISATLEPTHGLPQHGSLENILAFSGLSDSTASRLPVPEQWVVDWQHFFEMTKIPPALSRKISPFLSGALIDHKPEFRRQIRRGLVWLDLWRSFDPGLPSGQDIARNVQRHLGDTLKVPILTGHDLVPSSDATAQHISVEKIGNLFNTYESLQTATPLFYYVLQEALYCYEGQRLGPVGSFIMAIAFRSLLDQSSTDADSRIKDMPSFLKLATASATQFNAILQNR